jgi:GT2 family glycosyltransferase
MEFGTVMVSYGDEGKLAKALASLENQNKKPKYIQVIDNNSASAKFLSKWTKEAKDIKHLLYEPKNPYGPGSGFAHGLRLALEDKTDKPDFIVFFDENCLVGPDYLKKTEENYLSRKENNKDIIAFVPAVYSDDELDLGRHFRIEKSLFGVHEEKIGLNHYKSKDFPVGETFFQGMALLREKALLLPLPERDFYLKYIDLEYSLRLSENGYVVCLTDLELNLSESQEDEDSVSYATYYLIRNRLITYKRHFGKHAFSVLRFHYYCKYLSPWGKLKYHLDKKHHLKKQEMIRQAIYDAEDDKVGLNKAYIEEK